MNAFSSSDFGGQGDAELMGILQVIEVLISKPIHQAEENIMIQVT